MISLIVLNDIVNQNRELLQELRNFINTLYESGRLLKYHNDGHNDDWYIPRKSLNNNEINKFNSIYYNIKSSNDLIEPTIINIDKQNEIYQIIMRKNYLIMKSINILISMYNPDTTNYNNFNIQQLNKNDTHIDILNEIVKHKMASMLKPQDKTTSRQNLSHSDKSISSNQLINNIVNYLETLLQALRNFIDTFYIKERRLTNRDGGWYVENKKSMYNDENKKLSSIYSIYYNIKSSNDLIKKIITNIDKRTEIYEEIIDKYDLIMKSINILISMYNPGTTNYNKFNVQQLDQNDIDINNLNKIVKYKMASMLKPQDKTTSRQNLYHSDKSKSSNKMSSSRIDKSNPIVEDKTKSQSKYSHSYNSKSSRSLSLSNYITNDNNSELLLINPIGDGDCFINAIFDYGVYTGNLSNIYDRLIHFELLIENLPKYKDSINKAKSLFGGSPKLDKLTSEEYAKILYNTLIKESDKDTAYFKDRYKIPETQLLTCYNHPLPEDRNEKSKEYEIERKKFIKFMKYIQVLYVYTYGYKFIIKKLTNIFSIATTADLLGSFDFDINFVEYIKKKYYNINGILKQHIDIPTFLDDYMNFYAKTEGYYTTGDQISIFKKIFFKKLKLRNSDESIPCFWLNYEFHDNISLSTKEIKFMKTLRKSAEEVDNNKKFISIIRDGEHFKLFMYRYQAIIVENI